MGKRIDYWKEKGYTDEQIQNALDYEKRKRESCFSLSLFPLPSSVCVNLPSKLPGENDTPTGFSIRSARGVGSNDDGE